MTMGGTVGDGVKREGKEIPQVELGRDWLAKRGCPLVVIFFIL